MPGDGRNDPTRAAEMAFTPREEGLSAHPPPRIPDHELLRVIGRGAYGEVWLARNVMGTYRAVKVIYRDSFEHRRPYEREFEGIKRYEPVSRTHESQVAVLHVGRHVQDEYYYYVMELADDVSAEVRGQKSEISKRDAEVRHWNAYQPRTLHTELKRRGKLPLDECIALGLSLATALKKLHEHGLIHRDVKPGNVIFVNGVPKLADIGLVAEKDSPMSFVGTRGYFPPEGPGTAQADIYSLGKVLYEISTGKDRNEFPDLPGNLEDMTDENGFLEFNEILLKACHGDPRERYGSAQDVIEDLSLLQAGKSVKQKRSRERFWATAQKTAAFVAMALLVAGIGYWVAWKPAPGASVIPRRLPIDKPRLVAGPRVRTFDVSADGERVVFAGENGLSVWDAGTSIIRPLKLKGFGTLQTPENGNWLVPLHSVCARWAADDRHIVFQAVKKIGGTREEPIRSRALFQVDLETGEAIPIGAELPDEERVEDLCWLPDGKTITYLDYQRHLYTLSPGGKPRRWADAIFPEQSAVRLGGYSPDGRWLLLSVRNGSALTGEDFWDVWLMPHMGGRAVQVTARPGFDGDPAWGSDGETIYFASSGGKPRAWTWGLWKVRVDAKTAIPQGEMEPVLTKPGLRLQFPKLVGGGARLVYVAEEPNVKIQVADANRLDSPAIGPRGQDPALSPDGSTIYFAGETAEQQGIFAINRSGDSRTLRQLTELIPVARMSVSPDGERIAFFSYDATNQLPGIYIVPTAAGPPNLVKKLNDGDSAFPVWSPDGRWLAYAEGSTLFRVSADGKVQQPLASLYRWDGTTVRWSPDGTYLAALAYEDKEHWEEQIGVFVVNVATKTCRKLTPESEDKYKEGLEWHPGGKFLTYMYYGPETDSAQIRRAYLDGRPTDLMIDQEDHWDWVGEWDPKGERFFFGSSGTNCAWGTHVYEMPTGTIIHHAAGSYTMTWSQDQRTAVWAAGGSLRNLEVLEVPR